MPEGQDTLNLNKTNQGQGKNTRYSGNTEEENNLSRSVSDSQEIKTLDQQIKDEKFKQPSVRFSDLDLKEGVGRSHLGQSIADFKNMLQSIKFDFLEEGLKERLEKIVKEADQDIQRTEEIDRQLSYYRGIYDIFSEAGLFESLQRDRNEMPKLDDVKSLLQDAQQDKEEVQSRRNSMDFDDDVMLGDEFGDEDRGKKNSQDELDVSEYRAEELQGKLNASEYQLDRLKDFVKSLSDKLYVEYKEDDLEKTLQGISEASELKQGAVQEYKEVNARLMEDLSKKEEDLVESMRNFEEEKEGLQQEIRDAEGGRQAEIEEKQGEIYKLKEELEGLQKKFNVEKLEEGKYQESVDKSKKAKEDEIRALNQRIAELEERNNALNKELKERDEKNIPIMEKDDDEVGYEDDERLSLDDSLDEIEFGNIPDISDLTEEIREQNRPLHEQIDELKESLAEAKREYEVLEQSKGKEIGQLQKDLSDARKKVDDVNAELSSLSEKISGKEIDDLADKTLDGMLVESKEKALLEEQGKLQERISQLEEEGRLKDGQIQRLGEDLSQEKGVSEALEQDLGTEELGRGLKDKAFARLYSGLDEEDREELDELQQDKEELQIEVAELKRLLEQSLREKEEAKDKITAKDQEIVGLNEKLSTKDKDYEELERDRGDEDVVKGMTKKVFQGGLSSVSDDEEYEQQLEIDGLKERNLELTQEVQKLKSQNEALLRNQQKMSDYQGINENLKRREVEKDYIHTQKESPKKQKYEYASGNVKKTSQVDVEIQKDMGLQFESLTQSKNPDKKTVDSLSIGTDEIGESEIAVGPDVKKTAEMEIGTDKSSPGYEFEKGGVQRGKLQAELGESIGKSFKRDLSQSLNEVSVNKQYKPSLQEHETQTTVEKVDQQVVMEQKKFMDQGVGKGGKTKEMKVCETLMTSGDSVQVGTETHDMSTDVDDALHRQQIKGMRDSSTTYSTDQAVETEGSAKSYNTSKVEMGDVKSYGATKPGDLKTTGATEKEQDKPSHTVSTKTLFNKVLDEYVKREILRIPESSEVPVMQKLGYTTSLYQLSRHQPNEVRSQHKEDREEFLKAVDQEISKSAIDPIEKESSATYKIGDVDLVFSLDEKGMMQFNLDEIVKNKGTCCISIPREDGRGNNIGAYDVIEFDKGQITGYALSGQGESKMSGNIISQLNEMQYAKSKPKQMSHEKGSHDKDHKKWSASVSGQAQSKDRGHQ